MKKAIVSCLMVLALLASAGPKASAFTDKDCGDFSSKQEVMNFWYTNGYSASNDPHRLDRDKDGLPCEVSSGEYKSFVAGKTDAAGGWKQSGGNWYYYTSNGTPYKGWLNDGGKWYYLASNGAMKTGWLSTGGKWYFLDNSGVMKTGWLYNGRKWYYLDNSGAMKTGWLYDGGKWYFLDNGGTMKTGWIASGGTWYFLDVSGAMKTGWLYTGGKWYFLDQSGAMKTGWLEVDHQWYFLAKSGAMVTGWQLIDGSWYYFFNTGNMAYDTIIDGEFYVDIDGVWIPDALAFALLEKIQPIAAQYGLDAEVSVESVEVYEDGQLVAFVYNGAVSGESRLVNFLAEAAVAAGSPIDADTIRSSAVTLEGQLETDPDPMIAFDQAAIHLYSYGDFKYLEILWGEYLPVE